MNFNMQACLLATHPGHMAGFRNTSSQITASCTMDGKYVVCASEDSHVYIWKRDGPRNSSGKKVTTRSHEHFFCKDVLVAVPWPNGGTNCEPSPDLPSWSRVNNNNLSSSSNLEDMFPSSRAGAQKSSSENAEENQGSPKAGASISSSASIKSGHASGSSVSSTANSSASSSFSWGWGGNNRAAGGTENASAWGLVVVTAGLGGNIRVYQNFGLPLRFKTPNPFLQ